MKKEGIRIFPLADEWAAQSVKAKFAQKIPNNIISKSFELIKIFGKNTSKSWK